MEEWHLKVVVGGIGGPVYIESEQALLNTCKVTLQQCGVSFGR